MADESLHIRLRRQLAIIDSKIAGHRRSLRVGQTRCWQQESGQVAEICFLLKQRACELETLETHFPDDEYLSRPESSQPPVLELQRRFDRIAGLIRYERKYLTDGLPEQYKLQHLRSVRECLREADELKRAFRAFYPNSPEDSPELSNFRIRSDPTRFELDHPEAVSGTT